MSLHSFLPAILIAALLPVGTAHAAAGTYEAENATLSGGAAVASDHAGYSGGGFVPATSTATRASRPPRLP